MRVLSLIDLAAHVTACTGQYVTTRRISDALDRLEQRGEIAVQRVGGRRIIAETELAVIESAFGVTGEMVARAMGAESA